VFAARIILEETQLIQFIIHILYTRVQQSNKMDLMAKSLCGQSRNFPTVKLLLCVRICDGGIKYIFPAW
jgi:hypothetical protein